MDADQFIRFCEDCLEHPAGEDMGRPFRLEDWQVDLFTEALAVDMDGRPRWQTVATCIPRANGKTTMLAAYALYRLLADEDNPKILLCAASDRQANRLFEAARTMVERSPFLLERIAIQDYKGKLYRLDGLGEILRISSKPETAFGFRPSLVIADEVAQWTAPSLRRTWAALTTGGAGRRQAQVFAISTAGRAHERDDGILGRLLDANEQDGDVQHVTAALTVARNRTASVLTYNFAAPTRSIEDVDAILLANPRRGITREWLQRELASPETSTAEKLQLHGGVWSEIEEAWLSANELDAAIATRQVPPAGTKIALGFDGSRGGAFGSDATMLVAVTLGDEPFLWLLEHWERPDHLRRGEEWYIPVDQVTAAVTRACNRFRVRQLYADPSNWWSEIGEWRRRHRSAGVLEYPPTPRKMAPAIDRFLTDIRAGLLTWDGNPVLRKHLLSARIEKTRGETGARLMKVGRSEFDRIDGAIASVLAYQARADAVEAGRGRSAALQSY